MNKLFGLLFGLMILSCNPKVTDSIDNGYSIIPYDEFESFMEIWTIY